jgi:ATP-dependent Lon protease
MYELDVARDLHKNFDIHIHVPEGATPKEGPSAGITLATSIISLLTDIPVSKKVTMTGEITLKGKVLSVGGIKEKLLSAHREGFRKAIIPLDNKPDLKDLPKKIKEGIKIYFVENMDEVLQLALTKDLPVSMTTGVDKAKEDGESPPETPVTH